MTDLWQRCLVGGAAGLLVAWLALVGLLLVGRRGTRADAVREALRLLPDVVRLLRRLGADPALPRGVRLRLWLLAAYLVMPLDLVPDFIPVVGYADDAVVVAVAVRMAVRSAGQDALTEHWPGTPRGLAVVRRLAGLAP